jgi:short-subunit dehydrogenase
MRLQSDDVVVITGASRGIGKAAALAFAKKGCMVALLARDISRLEEVRKEIQSIGGKAYVFSCDVSKESDCSSTIEKVMSTLGRIDVLVNNAGYGHYGLVEKLDTNGLEKIMKTNLFGAIWCIQAALPYMKSKRRGHIVNVSTIISKRAFPQMGAYCMSKFAMTGMDESLGLELKPYGINVSLVCPGYTATDFQKNAALTGEMPDLQQKQGMKPTQVGEAIVRAVECNRRRTLLTFDGKLLLFVNKISPSLVDFVFSKILKQKTI